MSITSILLIVNFLINGGILLYVHIKEPEGLKKTFEETGFSRVAIFFFLLFGWFIFLLIELLGAKEEK